MKRETPREIVAGTVLEFYDDKKILCGVCTENRGERFAVITEQNREITLARGRVLAHGVLTLDLRLSRDGLVRRLQEIAATRKAWMPAVNVAELWSLLEGEEEGFTAGDLAEFIFTPPVSEDQTAAVLRVMLEERLFFKFRDGRFVPRSAAQIDQLHSERERQAEQEALLGEAAQWLRGVWQRGSPPVAPEVRERVVAVLKSHCLFGAEAPDYAFCRELLKRAGIPEGPGVFRLLVRLGVWSEDENLYLLQHGIHEDFPAEVVAAAAACVRLHAAPPECVSGRRDLRALEAFTIDSALTRDYDDALSLRLLGDGLCEVGVHIADAAELVRRGDAVDQEAAERATSIYLPEGRIPMLPTLLSEGICSLRAGEDRLALSFLVRMDEDAAVCGVEIVPSVMRVHHQMTYEEVNTRLDTWAPIGILHRLSQRVRARRIAQGAIVLPVPEMRVWVNPEGMIQVSRYEKETPSQIIVSELMILVNWLAAAHLAERKIPAIFRSQEECRPETNHVASDYELFHIYRQRRLFARAELGTEGRPHCSLGVPHYTSVSSPIRRYVDLVVQRQLKHALLSGDALYSEEELKQLITRLEVPHSRVMWIRRKWDRYWILKYLEQEDIRVLDALILDQNNRFAHLLLPDFIIEVNMPLEDKGKTRAGEMIRVKVDHVNPREDLLRVKLLSA